jgi:enamine deaminase RidA (YjgF/YER057c/UK114 family)
MASAWVVLSLDPLEIVQGGGGVEFLDGHRPPGTLVPVEMLVAPQLLFEIDVMAVVEVD